MERISKGFASTVFKFSVVLTFSYLKKKIKRETVHIWLPFSTSLEETADRVRLRALNERWLHRRETREGNGRFPVFFDSHDS